MLKVLKMWTIEIQELLAYQILDLIDHDKKVVRVGYVTQSTEPVLLQMQLAYHVVYYCYSLW